MSTAWRRVVSRDLATMSGPFQPRSTMGMAASTVVDEGADSTNNSATEERIMVDTSC